MNIVAVASAAASLGTFGTVGRIGTVGTDPTAGSTSVPADETVTAHEAFNLFLTRPATAIGVLLATWILTRLARSALRRLVRRIANRSLDHPTSFWRVRVPRLFGETAELAEKRRRQRIDATSKMMFHVVALIAWLTAGIVVLHIMQVDLIPVLTSAGFIGAALAIGGQHTVRDFISGIGILVEDRFGVGDRIVVESANGNEIDGVVEYVGAFSTRVSAGNSTWHLANGSLGQVCNVSQNPVTTELEVSIPVDAARGNDEAAADAVAHALRRAAGNRTLTGMVLVDDVRAAVGDSGENGATMKVEVRTAQPLTETQASKLERVMSDEIWRVHRLPDGDDDADSEGGEPD
ncbi:MAG TPA: mechanosensitive ion channel domain-containing protein [Ilumatobacteraceae bacterium]